MNHKTADKIGKLVMAYWRKHPELSVFTIHQLYKDMVYNNLSIGEPTDFWKTFDIDKFLADAEKIGEILARQDTEQ